MEREGGLMEKRMRNEYSPGGGFVFETNRERMGMRLLRCASRKEESGRQVE